MASVPFACAKSNVEARAKSTRSSQTRQFTLSSCRDTVQPQRTNKAIFSHLLLHTCFRLYNLSQKLRSGLQQLLSTNLDGVSIMRLQQFFDGVRSAGDDAPLVECWMRRVVVCFNLIHIDSFLYTMHLVYLPEIVQDGR